MLAPCGYIRIAGHRPAKLCGLGKSCGTQSADFAQRRGLFHAGLLPLFIAHSVRLSNLYSGITYSCGLFSNYGGLVCSLWRRRAAALTIRKCANCQTISPAQCMSVTLPTLCKTFAAAINRGSAEIGSAAVGAFVAQDLVWGTDV